MLEARALVAVLYSLLHAADYLRRTAQLCLTITVQSWPHDSYALAELLLT